MKCQRQKLSCHLLLEEVDVIGNSKVRDAIRCAMNMISMTNFVLYGTGGIGPTIIGRIANKNPLVGSLTTRIGTVGYYEVTYWDSCFG